jgi:hypothetical protein
VMFLMWLLTHLGRSRACMWCSGIALSTEFVKIFRPAIDK